jgi:hypothetical protein
MEMMKPTQNGNSASIEDAPGWCSPTAMRPARSGNDRRFVAGYRWCENHAKSAKFTQR